MRRCYNRSDRVIQLPCQCENGECFLFAECVFCRCTFKGSLSARLSLIVSVKRLYRGFFSKTRTPSECDVSLAGLK